MSYFTSSFDEQIVKLLQSGAVGFMPSDTVYGLSTPALNEASVQRIYKLKERDNHKPCVILLSDSGQARSLGINPESLKPMSKLWPAPLTFIVAAPKAPEFLRRGHQTLAVRVPSGSALRKLLGLTGPLISSSANLQGQAVARNIAKAKEYFSDRLDFYVDVGTLNGQPSTIVQIVNGKLKIIRQGIYELGKS